MTVRTEGQKARFVLRLLAGAHPHSLGEERDRRLE